MPAACCAADPSVDRQRERSLLVEAERVDAVDDDLAGERLAQGLEQRGVAVPRDRDDDDVGGARAVLVREAFDAEADLRRDGRRTCGIARADDDRLARHREATGESAALLPRSAEDADPEAGHVGKLAGVGGCRGLGHEPRSCHTSPVSAPADEPRRHWLSRMRDRRHAASHVARLPHHLRQRPGHLPRLDDHLRGPALPGRAAHRLVRRGRTHRPRRARAAHRVRPVRRSTRGLGRSQGHGHRHRARIRRARRDAPGQQPAADHPAVGALRGRDDARSRRRAPAAVAGGDDPAGRRARPARRGKRAHLAAVAARTASSGRPSAACCSAPAALSPRTASTC